MKAQCLICAERFIQSSVISATSCGHLFHHGCLVQWLERSKTCPNCRTTLGSRDVVAKLFLDSPDSTISDENDVDCVAALRNENSDLVAQLRESKNAKHDLTEDGKLKYYRIVKLENKLHKSADMLKQSSLKEKHYKVQLEFLKKENTRLDAAEMEVVAIKNELEIYNGKLTDVRNSNARLQKQVKGLKSDLAAAHGLKSKNNSLITTLRAENATLRESLEASEHELKSVNKKMESLHNKVRHQGKSRDTNYDRFILESPAPRLPKPSQESYSDSSIFLGNNQLKRRVKDNDHVSSSHLKSDKNKVNKPMKMGTTCAVASPIRTYGGGAYSSTRRRDGGYNGFSSHSKADVFPDGGVGIGAKRKVPIKKTNSIKVPKSSTDIRFFSDLID